MSNSNNRSAPQHFNRTVTYLICLAALFIPRVLNAQLVNSHFDPFLQAGVMSYEMTPSHYQSGPWINFGFKYYRDNKKWFADASFAYTRYKGLENTRSQYIHYRGGVGWTDARSLFGGLYLGYLENWDRKDGKIESATIDLGFTWYPLRSEKWSMNVTGLLGSSFSSLKYSEDLSSSLLLAGTIGINLNLSYPSLAGRVVYDTDFYLDPYVQGGFLSFKINPDAFILGPWVNLGAKYYRGNQDWFVDVGMAYTHYAAGHGNLSRFLHYRVGGGLTDSRNIFAGVFLGYLGNTDGRDRIGATTLDLGITFYPLIKADWALNVTGIFGSSLNMLKKATGLQSSIIIGGGIGYTWIIPYSNK